MAQHTPKFQKVAPLRMIPPQQNKLGWDYDEILQAWRAVVVYRCEGRPTVKVDYAIGVVNCAKEIGKKCHPVYLCGYCRGNTNRAWGTVLVEETDRDGVYRRRCPIINARYDSPTEVYLQVNRLLPIASVMETYTHEEQGEVVMAETF